MLCAASSVAHLLNQLAAAWASGNQVVVPASLALHLPDGLPAEVRSAILLADGDKLKTLSLSAALIDSALAAQFRIALAGREGALVPVVETIEGQGIPVWRLVAERALCVNTTAAGGNASLMTMGS